MTFNLKSLIVMLAVGLGLAVGNFGVYLVPFQVGLWVEAYDLSASKAGVLGMLEISVMSITCIFMSPIMPKVSKVKAAILGTGLAVLAQYLSAGLGDYTLLMAARVAVGVGCGVTFAAVVSGIALVKEPDQLMGYGNVVMNLFFMGIFILAPTAMGYSTGGLFLCFALVMLAIVPFLFSLPSGTESAAPAKDNSIVQELMKASVVIHILALILINLGLGGLWGFLELIGDNVNVSSDAMGKILSASSLAMIAGSLVAGFIGNKFGRSLPLLIGSLGCTLSVIIISKATGVDMFALGVYLYGAFYLFLGPYLIVGMSAAFEPTGKLAPTFGGIMFLSYAIGIGSAGVIVDALGLSVLGLAAAAVCAISAAILFLNARKYDRV